MEYMENIESGDYWHCYGSEDGVHNPDINTISSIDTGDPTLFDIWCSNCGLSGTVWAENLNTLEVNWGD